MNDLFKVEKDYRKKRLNIIKYSEMEFAAVGEVLIDFSNFKMLYKNIGIRGGRFKEPKEEDLFYFDYGHDLKYIYDEVKSFYDEVGDGMIKFYEIEEGLGVPLFKYLKIKLSFGNIDLLNRFYGCEMLLYSDRLIRLSLEELKTIYKILEEDDYLKDMYKVTEETLNLFKVNIYKALEYIHFAEYLYSDLNYDFKTIDEFFKLINYYNVLEDYRVFLKFSEIIRHNSDLYMLIEFIKTYKINNKNREELIDYVDKHIKVCRKEISERKPYSSNIMTFINGEKELKEKRIGDFNVIFERVEDLHGLLKSGYIEEFSELVLDLRDVYSEEDYKILLLKLKELIK